MNTFAKLSTFTISACVISHRYLMQFVKVESEELRKYSRVLYLLTAAIVNVTFTI